MGHTSFLTKSTQHQQGTEQKRVMHTGILDKLALRNFGSH
jgi:hypothetical protein